MPRDLHNLMLKVHLLGLEMLLRRGLSALQQWPLQKPEKAYNCATNDGVNRSEV